MAKSKGSSPKTNNKNGGKSTKGYPPPEKLSTPTDLKPAEVSRIAEAVNPIIADAFALYVKTKNFHWHLSGPRFRDYHVLFDEQAESILDSIDILAERLRRIGATTIRSISHIGSLQTISDSNDDFVESDDMIIELIKDNQRDAINKRKAIKITEDNNDSPTSNILQELLDATEKRIWFLFEISQQIG